jgi:hypothetical protein
MSDEMINPIPHPVKDSRYDRVMRNIWEFGQRLVFVEKSLPQFVDFDAYLELKERLDRLEEAYGQRKGITQVGNTDSATGETSSHNVG